MDPSSDTRAKKRAKRIVVSLSVRVHRIFTYLGPKMTTCTLSGSFHPHKESP